MKIVADENIPLLESFFGGLGDITALPGRKITASDLETADILLVRSVTEVNETLLKGTSVRFVGTCTIGTDHLDTDYLDSRNIAYANAPGCNAISVMNYVVSALVTLGESKHQDWRKFSVGVVGIGNVGSMVINTLQGLGMDVVGYDPYKDDYASQEAKDKVWQQDVVTLHTPITHSGDHPTHHMVTEALLNQMKLDACIINSGRGAVIDNAALKTFLSTHPQFSAILDVWENEPCPDSELMKLCLLATPHIAGYSLDGKLNGSAMIYEAVCEFLGLPKRLKLAQLMSEAPLRKIALSQEVDRLYVLNKAVRCMYDVRDDHFRMMSLMDMDDGEKREAFDAIRKNYPSRRDFGALNVAFQKAQISDELNVLGFKMRSK